MKCYCVLLSDLIPSLISITLFFCFIVINKQGASKRRAHSIARLPKAAKRLLMCAIFTNYTTYKPVSSFMHDSQ